MRSCLFSFLMKGILLKTEVCRNGSIIDENVEILNVISTKPSVQLHKNQSTWAWKFRWANASTCCRQIGTHGYSFHVTAYNYTFDVTNEFVYIGFLQTFKKNFTNTLTLERRANIIQQPRKKKLQCDIRPGHDLQALISQKKYILYMYIYKKSNIH